MAQVEKYEETPPTICISLEEDASKELPSYPNTPNVNRTSLELTPTPSVTPTLLTTAIPSDVRFQNAQLECGNIVGQDPRAHRYSEGGLKANMTVIGAFIGLFCTFGQMNAFGTFQAWYAAHQLSHMPASTISWIGSLQLWIFFFSGAPIGRLFDAYGPTWLMFAGTLCYVAGMIALSFSTQYYHYILSQGILLGLGVGLIFYPTLSSISTHFSKYRATALGIAIAGSGLGGVIYPITFRSLFEGVGFGWGVRISGLTSGVGCILTTLMVTSLSSHSNAKHFDLKTITDSRFIFLVIGSCFVALGIFIPFFYVVDYTRHLGIPDHIAFYLLAVMNAGGVLGRIAPAYVSDTIGRFNLLTPAAFLSGLSCVTLWLFLASNTGGQELALAGIVVFSVVFGFFSGAFISLVNPCVAQISDIGIIGTRIGVLYSVISFPSLFGGPAAGALLIREHGSYTAMIAFSGTTLMFGSVFLLAAKLRLNENILARV